MLTIATVPVSEHVRIRWVEDEAPDNSWMDDQHREALARGEMMGPYGCLVETKCRSCGAWDTEDSLWGIWLGPDEELDLKSAETVGMDIPRDEDVD